ncbi:MAG: hypothetical protein ABW173_03180 [Sphingomonas sp.]
MKIGFTLFAAAMSVAVPGVASAQDAAPAMARAVQGSTLYGAGGTRLGAIYRVAADGSPQLIIEGKLVTVPAATLSDNNGKTTTTLSRKELRASH